MQEEKIAHRQDRASRLQPAFYLPVHLTPGQTKRVLGPSDFEELRRIPPGKYSPVMRGADGFYILAVASYHPP